MKINNTVFGIDYHSNRDLFDIKKENFMFFNTAYKLFGKNKEYEEFNAILTYSLKELSKEVDIDPVELYRLDRHYFSMYKLDKFLLCMKEYSGYNVEDYIQDEDLIKVNNNNVKYIEYWEEDTKETSSCDTYIVNPIIGLDLHVLFSKDKAKIRKGIEDMYDSIRFLLKDEVTVIDILERSKYHSVINMTGEFEDFTHIIKEEI